jgi:hypothetical protein
MPFVELPRCPVCASSVSLREVYKLVGTDRLGLLRHKSGIVCPSCSTKLRISQGRSLLAVIGTFVLWVTIAATSASALPRDNRVIYPLAVVWALLLLAVQRFAAERFAVLKRREGSDPLDFPIEDRKQQLAKLQFSDEPEEFQPQANGPNWKCAQCGEENPSSFETCWKCNKARANGI